MHNVNTLAPTLVLVFGLLLVMYFNTLFYFNLLNLMIVLSLLMRLLFGNFVVVDFFMLLVTLFLDLSPNFLPPSFLHWSSLAPKK
jgi:Na+/H+ antiporter NhaC